MYFSSRVDVPLCSNFMVVEHIIIRIHFITRIASIDSHNPGQSLITNVDCVLWSTMPIETNSTILIRKIKICVRIIVVC